MSATESDGREGRRLITVVDEDPQRAYDLAELLADALRRDGRRALRARAVDFASPAGIDQPLLRSALLDPFLAGEAFALRGSRADGHVLFDPQWTSSAAPGAYLVVDGPPGFIPQRT